MGLALALAGGPTSASGQTVTGVVEDRGTGDGLVAVPVELVDQEGEVRARALTDGRGQFSLEAPTPGVYDLRAERLGASSLEVEGLELDEGERLERDLRLSTEPLSLEVLEVVGQLRTPEEEVARRSGSRRDIVAGEELAEAERHGDRVIDVVRRKPGVDVVEGTWGPNTPPPGTVCVELRRRIQGLDPEMISSCEMPLVVIDGTRVAGDGPGDAGRVLAGLRVEEFESVELLNGRQAYQQYGTDGAQGAIALHSRGSGPYQHPDREVAAGRDVDEDRVSHRRGFLLLFGGVIVAGVL